MADLAVVALGLDATGMKAGADQANRALGSVEKEMDAAQKKITELQGHLGTTNQSFTTFSSSAKGAASAVSALGGPVGQVAGQLQGLGGALEGLVQSFGLVGGAAVGALAALAALGGALVKLTLDGVKISDEMSDIAEATGLTIDQMQRLQAAFGAAGESIGGIERAFAAFEGLVQSTKDGSAEAAKTLNALGVNAQEASKDMGQAFIDVVVRLKDLTKTVEGSAAAHDAFSRQTGVLKRVSGELADIMGQSRGELEKFNKVAGLDGVAAAGRLDHEMNQLTQSFVIFKQNLAGTSIGRGLETYFETLNTNLRNTRTNTDLLILAWKNLSIAGQLTQIFQGPGIDLSRGPKRSLGVQETDPFKPNLLTLPKPPGGGVSQAGQQLATELKRLEEQNAAFRKTTADSIIKDAENILDAVRDNLKHILDLPELRALQVGLGIPGAPPISGGGIPGVSTAGILRPDQITSAREARIQDALGGVLEDFVFQITTARGTVSNAFKGLLLGITDTFAQEFALSVQKSLQDAFIKPLAGWLEGALTELFGGISAKGIGKTLGKLASLFVGFFAEGGTIPSGHWGVTGERGPEIAYAGSMPMHITPMSQMGGGGISVVNHFNISAPGGEVSARTQDQIADSAARGLERASRLRGAR